jgi:hypothetical protein
MRLVSLLALLCGLSCGGTSRLVPGFESALAPAGGCGDLYLVAGNAVDTTVLVFRADDGPLAKLAAGLGPLGYDFAAESGTLFVEQGRHVVTSVCAFEPDPDMQVDRRYHAIAGTATLSYDDTAAPPKYTLVLSGLVIHEEFGDHELALGNLTLAYTADDLDVPPTLDAGVPDAAVPDAPAAE